MERGAVRATAVKFGRITLVGAERTYRRRAPAQAATLSARYEAADAVHHGPAAVKAALARASVRHDTDLAEALLDYAHTRTERGRTATNEGLFALATAPAFCRARGFSRHRL